MNNFVLKMYRMYRTWQKRFFMAFLTRFYSNFIFFIFLFSFLEIVKIVLLKFKSVNICKNLNQLSSNWWLTTTLFWYDLAHTNKTKSLIFYSSEVGRERRVGDGFPLVVEAVVGNKKHRASSSPIPFYHCFQLDDVWWRGGVVSWLLVWIGGRW